MALAATMTMVHDGVSDTSNVEDRVTSTIKPVMAALPQTVKIVKFSDEIKD